MKALKYSFLFLFISLLFLFGSLSTKIVFADSNNFHGILDNGDNQPIAGAVVRLFNSTSDSQATTLSDGSFSVAVPSGTYALDVNLQGSVDKTLVPYTNVYRTNQDIVINSDVQQNIILPTHSLTVTVLDPFGIPVQDSRVDIGGSGTSPNPINLYGSEIANPVGSPINNATTDINGQAYLPYLPASTLTIEVTPPSGSNYATKIVTIDNFPTTDTATINFDPIFHYTGILRNGNNVPVSNAVVRLFNSTSDDQASTLSDGSFSIFVPSGTYTMDVNLQNGNVLDKSVVPYANLYRTNSDIIVNSDTDQDLTLPTHNLTVTVLDGAGHPLQNARVDVGGAGTSLNTITLFGNEVANSIGLPINNGQTNGSGQIALPYLGGSNIPVQVTPPTNSGLTNLLYRLSSFPSSDNITISYTSPSVGVISTSAMSVLVNTSLNATANFMDLTTGFHTAVWNWGDGSTSIGTVSENSGSGSISNSHTYTTVGVYTITLTVTNEVGESTISTYQYVPVYDSSTSFAGGRSYDNPATASPNTIGKVTFGISSKYTSSNTLSGSVKMSFKAANIDFASTSLNYLVSSNGKAILTGNGTVNGSGNYTFLITGIDGSVAGEQDMIRVQIKDQSGTVFYDSQPGATDTANPTTTVATGNVRVH